MSPKKEKEKKFRLNSESFFGRDVAAVVHRDIVATGRDIAAAAAHQDVVVTGRDPGAGELVKERELVFDGGFVSVDRVRFDGSRGKSRVADVLITSRIFRSPDSLPLVVNGSLTPSSPAEASPSASIKVRRRRRSLGNETVDGQGLGNGSGWNARGLPDRFDDGIQRFDRHVDVFDR